MARTFATVHKGNKNPDQDEINLTLWFATRHIYSTIRNRSELSKAVPVAFYYLWLLAGP